MNLEDWFRQTDSPRVTTYVTNPTWTGLDPKRSHRVETTTINRLVHGTASGLWYSSAEEENVLL
jgi:hypothetical protein